MKQTREIIKRAFAKFEVCLAFSGGGDSMVLLDIVTAMGFKPQLIYADSQMEYPETIQFVKKTADDYGLKLEIAKHDQTPIETWRKYGYPMLGKQSAREWEQKHKGFGFKCDVSTCCRKLKIAPARKLLKKLGFNCNMTGQRGKSDDRLRGLRAIKDGSIKYVKADKIYICNPLLGWTDSMIERYTKNHNLPVNPMKKKGALTIGCIYCGGGAQFTNSGFRVLRRNDPESWRKMIDDYGFGPIILAIKHQRPLSEINHAIEKLGGIKSLMERKPYVFDFLRQTPMKGYSR
jgi:phosphoadenosine phosphosulfate reductase